MLGSRNLRKRIPRCLATQVSRVLLSSNVVKSRYEMQYRYTDKRELKWSLPKLLLHGIDEDKNLQSKTAIIDGTNKTLQLTYKQLKENCYGMAYALQSLGIRPGDCVGIISPNNIHYFAAFHGIGLSGAASTPINPQYVEDEISYQLTVTEAKVLVVHPSCIEKSLPVIKKLGIIAISMGTEKFDGFLNMDDLVKTKGDPSQLPTVDPESTLTIPFSSGTTGKPKGVVLTHRNVVVNVLQVMPLEGNKLQPNPSQPDGGVLLVPLPFFHIYGMNVGMCVPVYARACMIFMPSFDLQKYLEIIQEFKVTRSAVVPPIVLGLAKHPMVDKYDLKSLKALMSGAAPLGGDIQKACADRLGCIVKQAWGMTELSPCGTITPDEEIVNVDFIKGKSGVLAPETEAKIVDPVTGKDMSPFEEGELLIRGPQVMKGYLKNPEATANTINPEGWLHTGDVAHFDKHGWLYITDRCKELIKYKGFQVAPAELEAIIGSMPTVKDVIVIPVLNEEAGELPRAYVVKQDNPTAKALTDKDIIEFVAAKVAPHKRLRGGVIFTDAVPKSASGKLLRRVQIQLDRQNNST